MWFQNGRQIFVTNMAPLKWHQKAVLALVAVPVLIFILIPALVITVIYWMRTMAVMNKQMKKEQERREASRPKVEIIIPEQMKLEGRSRS